MITLLLLALSGCARPTGSAVPAPGAAKVSLVYSNDVEGEIEPCG